MKIFEILFLAVFLASLAYSVERIKDKLDILIEKVECKKE